MNAANSRSSNLNINKSKSKNSIFNSRKFPAKSQALLYEVHLKELYQRYPKRPCKERVIEVFRVFDEIIPQSGNIQTVLELIRDELFESVFSKFFTSSEQEPYIERIPFFQTSEKMTSMRKEEVKKTNETFKELKERINDKNYELSIVYRKNLAYKQDNIEKEKIIKDLKEKYTDVEAKLKSVEGERLLMKTMNNNQVEIMKSKIDLLKTSLQDAGETINQINIYRDSLDNWKFINEKKWNNKNPVDMITIAENDKKETLLIYDQLSNIVNCQVDEYESQLDKLRQNKSSNIINDDTYMQELNKVVEGFKNRIKNLFDEQEQLRQHYKKLNILINNYKNTNKFSKTSNVLDDINRQYSIMVVCSDDNGYTYKPLKSFEYCYKCQFRTALCPHKKCDINIEIPPSVTNVRLVHPDLYVWNSDNSSLEEIDNNIESEDIEGKYINVSEITKIPTFQKIWKTYFYKNDGIKPLISRNFSTSKLIGIIWEVFNARYIIEEDPFFKNDERLKTFSETFYSYVYKKYAIDKISKFVLHDIIQSLQTNDNLPIVTLYARTLSGEEDCSWKYYYILSQFIRLCNDFSSNNILKLFKTIYPMKSESFYEELEFDYQSFCKGKSTKDSFLDYILFLIKKQAEPNYQFFLDVLHRYDHQNHEYLEFSEYIEFASQMVSQVQYNSAELQYRISEQVNSKQDCVPLEKLSYITCYLFVYSVKKNYKWNFMESLTKEYINHSNVAFLENVTIEELNHMIEKAKLDTINSEAVDLEMENMSERVDQLLRKDGIDIDVINECIKNGQPIPDDIADSIIRREIVKHGSSNTNLKVEEKVREILEEREKNKLFDSEESIDIKK
ncbi:hypothetical protein BCR36DRAFT_354014 [Piromyces finnis]|uniref:Uncharacterized protein n=1 Tax=Piromyces finnis TaxID=1754191 RepID=A0A1Y1V746_9FUNG|nr:hypothetical protein BCR36DRAFT_354014 [Piromyces finnis]|eukprot:ORX48927.1 hypothetical protein BCR36DRAFT_354014 [Piromyces finnis]